MSNVTFLKAPTFHIRTAEQVQTEPRLGFTFAKSRSQTKWDDRREYSFDALSHLLAESPVGKKDGSCYTPAIFSGTARKLEFATQIDVVVLDSDCGHSFEFVRDAIAAKGWRAIVHSTHSHRSDRTTMAAAAADAWLAETPGRTIGAYMVAKKGYQPTVVQGAVEVERRAAANDKIDIIVQHHPCPKFRILLPLNRPWVAADHASQQAANAVWKERIGALAGALGLAHDQSCVDTSRLFYLPRRRDEEQEFVFEAIEGTGCDLWGLPTAALKGGDADAIGLPLLTTASRPGGTQASRKEHVTADGEVFNLVRWAAGYASRFEVVTALKARAPAIFSTRRSGTKHHIFCPNNGSHFTNSGDGDGTYAVNASELSGAGLTDVRGFVIQCLHGGCKAAGHDRLDHLQALLTDGSLTVADLTDDAFLVPEAEIDVSALLARVQTKTTGKTSRAQEAIDAEAQEAEFQAAINAVVNDFNRRFMVVNEQGKAVIFQPSYDPILKRRCINRLMRQDLETLYMNDILPVGIDAKGNIVFKSTSSIWLNHKRRLSYRVGVEFNPNAKMPTAGVLNLWEGFAINPAEGDWTLLRKHILDNICGGNEEYFNYLICWIARMFQNPGEQGEVAVVLKGGEGTGKGTLAKVLMNIIGQHAMSVNSGKHLVGNFNAHLRDLIFLFADEAFFAGDKAHVGALKSLITEPYLTIEGKFQNTVQTPNFLHIMMASNEDWVVPASKDARRYFVLETSEKHKQNIPYFSAIWKQMDNGGYAAMLHDMLNVDLSEFNVRDVPKTEGLQEQRKLSLNTVDAWWQDCLFRGYVFRSKLGLEDYFARWASFVTKDLLYDSYMEFAKSRGERHPLSREGLGKFFVGQKASLRRPATGVTGERLNPSKQPETVIAHRPPGFHFGSLEETQAVFVAVTGIATQWDDPETD